MILTIEKQVKISLRDISMDEGRRKFLKVVLGEFNRVDDGKSITDEQAYKVLKKMIKNNLEMIELVGDVERVALKYENKIIDDLMPEEDLATRVDMLKAIANSVPPMTQNRMSCMRPCIQYLEDKGLTIDKKQLSQLLREGE